MNKKLIISLILSIIGIVLILANKGIDIDEDEWCLKELKKDYSKITEAEFNDPHYLTSRNREYYACFGRTEDYIKDTLFLEKEDIDYLGSDNFNRRLVLIGYIILVIGLIVFAIVGLKINRKNRGESG